MCLCDSFNNFLWITTTTIIAIASKQRIPTYLQKYSGISKICESEKYFRAFKSLTKKKRKKNNGGGFIEFYSNNTYIIAIKKQF